MGALSADDIVRRRMVGLQLWRSSCAAPGDVVRRLVAMQAQEHTYARWSVAQRCGATAATVDSAFDDGQLLRTHVLRPTWHYVAPEDLRWLLTLSGPLVDRRNARRYAELDLDARTRARGTDVIAAAVADGPKTRRELASELEGRRLHPEGQRLPHFLMHAELHLAVCSGPMRGKQHTYAAFDDRVPGVAGPNGDEALAELARRYIATRGPVTVRDFAWWAGLSVPAARAAVMSIAGELERADVDGRTCWFAADAPPLRPRRRRADLVQLYDEVIISYTESRDLLATEEVSFPVPGHVDGFSHVVLLDGRLLGHWRVRSDGIETRLPEWLAPDGRAAVEAGSSAAAEVLCNS